MTELEERLYALFLRTPSGHYSCMQYDVYFDSRKYKQITITSLVDGNYIIRFNDYGVETFIGHLSWWEVDANSKRINAQKEILRVVQVLDKRRNHKPLIKRLTELWENKHAR